MLGVVRAGFLEAAGMPHHAAGQILPSDIPGKENRVYRRPVGVVCLISPWGFPMYLTNRTLAPALALGNAVVLKPSSNTPVTGGLLLAKILEEAGLPAGVLNEEDNAAYSGEKLSGLGRFGGTWSVDEFTTHHWVSLQHSRRPYPMPAPA